MGNIFHGTHSEIGASSAERWTNCPGSVNLCRIAPPQQESEAAREGTAAHNLADICIGEATQPREYVGMDINGVVVTEEMADAVSLYMTWAFEKREQISGRIEVESSFDLSQLHHGMFGRNDICIYKTGGRLVVGDFKYGLHPVDVKENKQLLFYALGAMLKYGSNFTDVELVIIQPRAPHIEGAIRSWVVSKEYLLTWSVQLMEAARLTEKKDAPLYRGYWCGYCPAKGICPKMKEAVDKVVEVAITEPIATLPVPSALSDKQIAKIVENTKLIEDFLSSVKEYALSRLKSGEKIEGLKLVAGRGRRVWSDDSLAKAFLMERLGEQAFEKKLLSVAGAEKLLDKKDLIHLWSDVAGSETVTHASDKRKEVMPLLGDLKINKGVKGA